MFISYMHCTIIEYKRVFLTYNCVWMSTALIWLCNYFISFNHSPSDPKKGTEINLSHFTKPIWQRIFSNFIKCNIWIRNREIHTEHMCVAFHRWGDPRFEPGRVWTTQTASGLSHRGTGGETGTILFLHQPCGHYFISSHSLHDQWHPLPFSPEPGVAIAICVCFISWTCLYLNAN